MQLRKRAKRTVNEWRQLISEQRLLIERQRQEAKARANFNPVLLPKPNMRDYNEG